MAAVTAVERQGRKIEVERRQSTLLAPQQPLIGRITYVISNSGPILSLHPLSLAILIDLRMRSRLPKNIIKLALSQFRLGIRD